MNDETKGGKGKPVETRVDEDYHDPKFDTRAVGEPVPGPDIAARARQKKHHVIPVWYMKNFADPRERHKVYHWRKDENPKWRHPKAIFYTDGINHGTNSDGTVVIDAETPLGELDRRHADAVAETLNTAAAAASRGAAAVPIPLADLVEFAGTLMGRSRAFRTECEEMALPHLAHDTRSARNLVLGASLQVSNQNSYVLTRCEANLVATCRIELIFGTAMFSRLADAETGGEYLLLPLAPQIGIAWRTSVPAGDPGETRVRIRDLGDRTARAFNTAIAHESDEVAGHRRLEIQHLRRAYDRRRRHTAETDRRRKRRSPTT